MTRPFDVAVAQDGGGSFTITLGGELDLATVERAREALQSVPVGSAIVLDLTGLTFIDSTGLGLIAEASTRTEGRLSVIPNARTRRLLDLTGMTEQLNLVEPPG
jgi:anti-anti-sigma factor